MKVLVKGCVCAEMAEAVEAAPTMTEQLAGPSTDALLDADERRKEEERRRARDPPIVYKDIDVRFLFYYYSIASNH